MLLQLSVILFMGGMGMVHLELTDPPTPPDHESPDPPPGP